MSRWVDHVAAWLRLWWNLGDGEWDDRDDDLPKRRPTDEAAPRVVEAVLGRRERGG